MESSLLVILRRHSLGLEWQQQSLKVTKEIIQKPFIRQFSWRFWARSQHWLCDAEKAKSPHLLLNNNSTKAVF